MHAHSVTSLSEQDQLSLLIAFQGMAFQFLSCLQAMMWTLTWTLSVLVGMTCKRRRAAVGTSNTRIGSAAAAENVMHLGLHYPQKNREAMVTGHSQ